MSSPSGAGPGLPSPARRADTADVPTRTAGTRTIPGPRLRGAGRPLPAPPSAPAPHLPAARRPGPRLPVLHPGPRHPALTSATTLAVLTLVGCGVLILHLVRRQTGTTGLLVGLGLAVLPLPFVLGALAWLNQTARLPLRQVVFCLAWGASAATTVAILANGWASDFLVAHEGVRGETLGADFATPLIEESAKGAALLLLLLPPLRRLRCHGDLPHGDQAPGDRAHGGLPRRAGRPGPRPASRPRPRPRAYARARRAVHARPHLRLRPYLYPLAHLRPSPSPVHPPARSRPRTLAGGIVLGGVTACGFAFTENALYLGRAFSDDQQQRLDSIGLGGTPSLRDFDGTVQTFVLRGLLSPFAHPLFTALTGLGLAVALTTGRRRLARLAAPGGLLTAMVLHGTWNAAAGLGTHGFLLVYGLLMVPCFAALVCLAVWATARTAHHPPRRRRPVPAPAATAETR